jgi:hypothetical protein
VLEATTNGTLMSLLEGVPDAPCLFALLDGRDITLLVYKMAFRGRAGEEPSE